MSERQYTFHADINVRMESTRVHHIEITAEHHVANTVNTQVKQAIDIANAMVEAYGGMHKDNTVDNIGSIVREQLQMEYSQRAELDTKIKDMQHQKELDDVRSEYGQRIATILSEEEMVRLKRLNEISDLKTDYECQLTKLRMECEAVKNGNSELSKIKADHRVEIEVMRGQIALLEEATNARKEADVANVKATYEKKMAEMKLDMTVQYKSKDEENRSELNTANTQHYKQCVELQREIDELRHEVQRLEEFRDVSTLVRSKMENIDKLVSSTDNNQLGDTGELLVYNYLKDRSEIGGANVQRVNGKASSCDITLKWDGITICIEVKNHTDGVSKTHVNRFRSTDINHEGYDAGLFVSVRSGYSTSLGISDFHIEVNHGKPTIFISNVVDNMDRISTAIKMLTYMVNTRKTDDGSIQEYITKVNAQISHIKMLRTQINVNKTTVKDMETIVGNMEKDLVGQAGAKYRCHTCGETFRLKREFTKHGHRADGDL